MNYHRSEANPFLVSYPSQLPLELTSPQHPSPELPSSQPPSPQLPSPQLPVPLFAAELVVFVARRLMLPTRS